MNAENIRFRTKEIQLTHNIFKDAEAGILVEEIAASYKIKKKRVENTLKKPMPIVFSLAIKDAMTDLAIENIVAEDFNKAVRSSIFKFRGYFSGLALKNQWRIVDKNSGLSICLIDINREW